MCQLLYLKWKHFERFGHLDFHSPTLPFHQKIHKPLKINQAVTLPEMKTFD